MNPYQHRKPIRRDRLFGDRSGDRSGDKYTRGMGLKLYCLTSCFELSYSLEKQAILGSGWRRTLSFVISVRRDWRGHVGTASGLIAHVRVLRRELYTILVDG